MYAVKLLTLLAAIAVASPAKVEKRDTQCKVNIEGVNQEGGGGPGQQPINQNTFSAYVNGIDPQFNEVLTTDASGSFAFAIEASDYGGNHNMYIEAVWNYGGNDWSSCQISFDGGDYIDGTIEQNIQSGTVSNTYGDCYWFFDC